MNNSPAVRFLHRGNHLMRLQGRITKPMMADTEAEHQEVKDTVISADTNMKQFVRDTMMRMRKSQERWEDIDLMFQLFFCRFVDNFQIFVEELITDAVRREPQLAERLTVGKAADTLSADERLERQLRKLSFMSLSKLIETLEAHGLSAI